MAAENQIVSIEFDVNKRIDERVAKILEAKPITLPNDKHPLVEDYIRRIEGTYDVSRSKRDTDNAVDLLYIAYNTTPQEEGKIRVQIDNLMKRLIDVQQESERKMRGAAEAARSNLKSLQDVFPGWQEVCEVDNIEIEDLKAFIGEDLLDLAQEIKQRAERIHGELTQIANTYDGIINDTTTATNQGQEALATRLKNKEEIEKEITRNNAEREKLESMVADLKTDIAKYEQMANDYKSRAETAEERAFIMSIVRVGAQMLSSMVPAITAGITAAATGGGSLIAGAASNTVGQQATREAAATENDNTAKVIKTKQEIADKNSEKLTATREKSALEENGKVLTTEKAKIQNDEKLTPEAKDTQLQAINKRIEANDAEIKKKDKQISDAVTALNALSDGLKSLGENLDKMTAKQEEQGTNLRSLQMKMLEKVEAYEKERRTQAAELVKINALLKGKRTEAETIQLAIKSLNLSLKALKAMREIIVEIAFFFKSFADFMQLIIESATNQSETIQKAIEKEKLTKAFTNRLKRTTNDFFITQTAQWRATEVVSAKFVNNFNDGWSKLNKLSGKYLTGDELKAYLDAAAQRIEEISLERQQAATAKLTELNQYRDLIQAKVLPGNGAATGGAEANRTFIFIPPEQPIVGPDDGVE